MHTATLGQLLPAADYKTITTIITYAPASDADRRDSGEPPQRIYVVRCRAYGRIWTREEHLWRDKAQGITNDFRLEP